MNVLLAVGLWKTDFLNAGSERRLYGQTMEHALYALMQYPIKDKPTPWLELPVIDKEWLWWLHVHIHCINIQFVLIIFESLGVEFLGSANVNTTTLPFSIVLDRCIFVLGSVWLSRCAELTLSSWSNLGARHSSVQQVRKACMRLVPNTEQVAEWLEIGVALIKLQDNYCIYSGTSNQGDNIRSAVPFQVPLN